jgi:hypothetical protein
MTEQETNTIDKDVNQVSLGSCCGRFVPESHEIERTLAKLGIERTAEHREFTMEPEEDEGFELEATESDGNALVLSAMHGMSKHLKLPGGTPRHFPPFVGATQRFSERTRRQVSRIRRKAPGLVCATYFGHGRTGEPWGIDIMVSPLHQKAQGPQKHLGNALVRWLLNNWAEMHLNYVIWLNQMNDGAGWFSYEPFIGSGGHPNPVTQRHLDHVHVQVMNPNLGPFQ